MDLMYLYMSSYSATSHIIDIIITYLALILRYHNHYIKQPLRKFNHNTLSGYLEIRAPTLLITISNKLPIIHELLIIFGLEPVARYVIFSSSMDQTFSFQIPIIYIKISGSSVNTSLKIRGTTHVYISLRTSIYFSSNLNYIPMLFLLKSNLSKLN